MGKTIMIKLLHCGRIWRNAPERDARPDGAQWVVDFMRLEQDFQGPRRQYRGNTEEPPRNHR
ncbi:hypothetical protein X946_3897 [Burkholderia sp. ABCPW 111]|nr:hypothetical protein X946_3897 [Burkholderia sp. ABCPW 111]